ESILEEGGGDDEEEVGDLIEKQEATRQKLWEKLNPEERNLICLGVVLYELALQIRGTVFSDLAGQPCTKNAFLGATPEIALKVHGVDTRWGLLGFSFKGEHSSEKDALHIDQFLALICGQTGKSAQARQRLLEKSLVIMEQQSRKPFNFALGSPGKQDWVSKVQLAQTDWYDRGPVRNFIDTVDSMLLSNMKYKDWGTTVKRIIEVAIAISNKATSLTQANPEEEDGEEEEGASDEEQ
ncbi:unnamed protein product, partial [Prorocentrum cordatum]